MFVNYKHKIVITILLLPFLYQILLQLVHLWDHIVFSVAEVEAVKFKNALIHF